MSGAEPYKVELDVFEGPLDLLLYLIKQDEVDIYDIPIERITDQYMQYLDVMKMLDLNIAGEFIVMAATLMMIKSRMLLPVEERHELEEEEDPRWDLVRQLVEYKKFKDAASHLGDLESIQENLFGRTGEGVQLGPEPDIALEDVSIFDLISAFNTALKNAPREELQEIFAERYTVEDKVDEITAELRSKGHASLSRMLAGVTHRFEMVCTFLAILELIRLRKIRAKQSGHFGEIDLVPCEDD